MQTGPIAIQHRRREQARIHASAAIHARSRQLIRGVLQTAGQGGFGWDLYKSWAFCASFEESSRLACTCKRPVGTRESIAGAMSGGAFLLSQLTAEYPASLAQQLASCVARYPSSLGFQNADISDFAQFLPEEYLPRRPRLCDGAGVRSAADHTHATRSVLDRLVTAIQQ